MNDIRLTPYESPLGAMTIATDGEFLVGLWFDGQKYDRAGLANESTSKVSQSTILQLNQSTIRQVCHPTTQSSSKTFQTPLYILPVGKSTGEGQGGEAVRQGGEAIIHWLDTYFSGQQPTFTPPLRVNGSPFRQMVSEIMLAIPYGQTTTYGAIAREVARRTGRPRISAQAVGGAVGHNAISLIIPCHRVLGSNGSLTGYAGGLERKKALLALEQRL